MCKPVEAASNLVQWWTKVSSCQFMGHGEGRDEAYQAGGRVVRGRPKGRPRGIWGWALIQHLSVSRQLVMHGLYMVRFAPLFPGLSHFGPRLCAGYGSASLYQCTLGLVAHLLICAKFLCLIRIWIWLLHFIPVFACLEKAFFTLASFEFGANFGQFGHDSYQSCFLNAVSILKVNTSAGSGRHCHSLTKVSFAKLMHGSNAF